MCLINANKGSELGMEFRCYFDKIDILLNGLNRVYEVSQNTGTEAYTKFELDIFGFFNDIRGDFVFDKTRIKNLSEKPLLASEMKVKQISPLVSNEGLLYITNRRIYFQPYKAIQAVNVNCYNIKDIRKIFKRRYMLMRKGLEFWTEEESVYLAFRSSEERDLVYDQLMLYIEDAETEESLMHYTEQWVKGDLSNFDYLMKLNYHSYRSRSDLTQYPVFPWVLKDYESAALDLNNEDSFRDLTKPMGALNEERLEEYKRRYNEIPEGEKYLYGTHYSAPGYVIGYLFRKHPRWMIKFQGGHFDNPNRLFKGIALEYDS
jgi:factor associated with neutral sphingomyelinase activation